MENGAPPKTGLDVPLHIQAQLDRYGKMPEEYMYKEVYNAPQADYDNESEDDLEAE
jgi:hypothetical protein